MLVAQGMEKRRALDVMVLDMRELMTICDYFVICHGRSLTHVEAIAETVEEHLSEHGLRPNHIEGRRGATWVILDCGSTVGHIFTEETRDFYDLERLWEGAPVVDHLDGGEPEATEAPEEPPESEQDQ
jgi:ribosome-associated protein